MYPLCRLTIVSGLCRRCNRHEQRALVGGWIARPLGLQWTVSPLTDLLLPAALPWAWMKKGLGLGTWQALDIDYARLRPPFSNKLNCFHLFRIANHFLSAG